MSKQKQQPKGKTNKGSGKSITEKRSIPVKPVPTVLNPNKPSASGSGNQTSGSGSDSSSSSNSSNKKK
jgi:hypothetical protein